MEILAPFNNFFEDKSKTRILAEPQVYLSNNAAIGAVNGFGV
jgi:hypothetical protein